MMPTARHKLESDRPGERRTACLPARLPSAAVCADRIENFVQMEQSAQHPMTLRQFFDWCDRQRVGDRYELVDGFPVAMAPASNAHNRLMMALNDLLRPRAAERGCDAFTSGPLVPTKVDGNGRIPDNLVTCDERDQRDSDDAVESRVIRHPNLVAGILSPTTAEMDLGPKKTEYEIGVPSIEEYLVLSGHRPWARVYRRDTATGKFADTDYAGGTVPLASIGLVVDLGALYAAARIKR